MASDYTCWLLEEEEQSWPGSGWGCRCLAFLSRHTSSLWLRCQALALVSWSHWRRRTSTACGHACLIADQVLDCCWQLFALDTVKVQGCCKLELIFSGAHWHDRDNSLYNWCYKKSQHVNLISTHVLAANNLHSDTWFCPAAIGLVYTKPTQFWISKTLTTRSIHAQTSYTWYRGHNSQRTQGRLQGVLLDFLKALESALGSLAIMSDDVDGRRKCLQAYYTKRKVLLRTKQYMTAYFTKPANRTNSASTTVLLCVLYTPSASQ